MLTLSVRDRFFTDIPPGAFNEGGQESMHCRKEWQVLEGAAADQLEAASGIGGVVA